MKTIEDLQAELESTRAELDKTTGMLQLARAGLENTEQALRALQKDYLDEQNGAFLWIAAVVGRAVAHGTRMTFSKADMEEAAHLILQRAEGPDGGVILLVEDPVPAPDPDFHPIPEPPKKLITELSPVLAKAKKTIVLLDANGEPNQ